ncbi:MAG TPA: hypothetical protein VGC76_05300 [Pyrinomonadaceae bacterium]|jgi:hypothetical protein
MSGKLKLLCHFYAIFALLISCGVSISAQTAAFTYQGRFTDLTVSQPTNGTYTMKFRLYDALENGNQVGSEQTFRRLSGRTCKISDVTIEVEFKFRII